VRWNFVFRVVVLSTCWLLSSVPGFGQKLKLGVVAGASVTDDFKTASFFSPGGILPSGETQYSTTFLSNASRHFLVGPRLEVVLPWRLSVEAEALNRPIRSTSKVVVFPPFEFPEGVRVDTFGPFTSTQFDWQFNLLGKYRISKGRVRPFVESGLSVLPVENTDTRGITAGSGIEMRVSRLNITPAVRYTNWVTNRGRGAFPNQVQFVVGVSEASDAISPTAFGRELSLGVVAGLALSEGLRPSSPTEHSDSINVIGGVTVSTPLTKNLSLEIDGLYRPMHIIEGTSRSAFLTWEFPFLMKYKVNRPRVSPFAELGPSLRAIAHVTPRDHSHYGITGGTGVEARLSRLKIAPAIRYARWARDKNRFGQDTYLSTRQHQIELVIGFSFQNR
jgi:hypothetical protein